MNLVDRRGNEVSGPRLRREWKVDIGYNNFQPLNTMAIRDIEWRQLFAHWGVYIRDPKGSPTDRNCKVYSTNFDGSLGQNLVMEATWTTNRGWQREMSASEVPRVNYNNNIEHTFYFAIEEFQITAQNVLAEFLALHTTANFLERGGKWLARRAMSGVNGDLYNVLSMNCQDFSEYLINNLKTNDWGNPQRVENSWDASLQILEPFRTTKLRDSRGTKRARQGGASFIIIAEIGFSAALLFYCLGQDEPSDPKILTAISSLLGFFIHEILPRHRIIGTAISLWIYVTLHYVRLDAATILAGTWFLLAYISIFKKTLLRVGTFTWILVMVADTLYRYKRFEISNNMMMTIMICIFVLSISRRV